MSNNFSIADELIKLKKLVDEGILTETEFQEQKARLLNSENDSLGPQTNNSAEPLYNVSLIRVDNDFYEDTVQLVMKVMTCNYGQAIAVTKNLPHIIMSGATLAQCQIVQEKFRGLYCTTKREECDRTVVQSEFDLAADLSKIPDRASELEARVASSAVTCPYCHSTNVEKITMGKKVRKGFFWGVAAASTLTKEWHCKNCKSNF